MPYIEETVNGFTIQRAQPEGEPITEIIWAAYTHAPRKAEMHSIEPTVLIIRDGKIVDRALTLARARELASSL